MPKRILIADDSSFMREQLRGFLEGNSSWQVFEATNGLEAVQKTEQIHPDVIVLDFSMPVMDGLTAARELHRIASDTPVLLFSMHSTGWLKDAARETGAVGVVSKSDWFRLRARLEGILAKDSAAPLSRRAS